MRNRNFVGVILPSGQEQEKMFCVRCEKRGHMSLLGPKVIQDISKPPTDYDDWLQCYRCGNLVPIYNVRHEGDLYSDLEITENPFDAGKSVIVGLGDVAKGRLNPRYQRLIKKQKQHPDPEVAKIEAQGDIVTDYRTDMP